MARNLISSHAAIRAIKAGDPRQRLSDGDGLFLLLFVKGGSHGWRFSYSYGGKRQLLSLGTFPDTSLKLARRKADELRTMVAEGIDPSAQRKAAKVALATAREAEVREAKGLPPVDSFEAIAREWYEVKRGGWAASYAERVMARLEADVFPRLGRVHVNSISPPELLAVLRRIEERSLLETARRILDSCRQIFRPAIATGKASGNPARDLKDALKKHHTKHMPAITDPKRFGELLRAIEGYAGSHVVRAAMKLAPMLLLRPGELRFAEWSEMDLDAALWTVPAARMKRQLDGKRNGPPHFVPLPTQAVGVLRQLREETGDGRLVFRGERHHERVMSDNTINAALRTIGFGADEVTVHGFRATARTMLDEQLEFDPDVIEAQLAHSVKDSLGRAYNRTEFLARRREMMQTWADYLDQLRSGVNETPRGESIGAKRARRSSFARQPSRR